MQQGNVIFRSTSKGAWRKGHSPYGLSHDTVTTEFFGAGWECCTLLMPSGVRENLRVRDRLNPLKRKAKWLDADRRWVDVILSTECWTKVEPSGM